MIAEAGPPLPSSNDVGKTAQIDDVEVVLNQAPEGDDQEIEEVLKGLLVEQVSNPGQREDTR